LATSDAIFFVSASRNLPDTFICFLGFGNSAHPSISQKAQVFSRFWRHSWNHEHVTMEHRCRNKQFLGCVKDFCQNFSKLPKKITSKKEKNDCISFHFGRIFKIKAHQAQFLSKYPPNLPKYALTCQKKTKNYLHKKRLHFGFGRQFLKINAHQTILRTFSHIFAQIVTAFTRTLTKSKFSGGNCTPCTPASCTTATEPLL